VIEVRLAVITSHPIQYYAPIFRMLDRRLDLEVFYAHRATPLDQAKAGFNTAFEWDIDLLAGYRSHFLTNVARRATTNRFFGCDTPEIAQRISTGNFDAVLVLGWYLKSFIQAIVAAKRSGIPVLVRGDSQLMMPSSPAKALVKDVLYPPALRVFNAALYVGLRSRQYYERYCYPSDRLFFSPHCVDIHWFGARGSPAAGEALRKQKGICKEEAVVLFAGKLLSFKRPLDVVEAAGCLKARGRSVTLMVAGSGPLEESMRNRAAQIGVKLVLLGFQNQTEMPACYAACDVLVIPSTGRETWGLVANEALACGRPIIVSDAIGCAPDLAADGFVGRTFPLGNYQKLSDAIAAVIDHPPSYEAIKRRSYAYSIDVACDGIIRALEFVKVPRARRKALQ
jgi:glycosyltransferase involved in cell wall biosynthesis